MKKITLIALLLIISGFTFAGNKIELKWNKFDAGIAEAKKTKRKILVDIYADWCKWCKKLDTDVYGNENVAAYLNKYYVLIKVNGESNDNLTYKGEKMTEQRLSQSFGTTGFPTIIFLESGGDALDRLGGYVPAEKFLPIIHYIGEDYYKNLKWEEFMQKYGNKIK